MGPREGDRDLGSIGYLVIIKNYNVIESHFKSKKSLIQQKGENGVA